MATKDEGYGWLAMSQLREAETCLNLRECERRSIMFLLKLFSYLIFTMK